jgi:hypothetical protein
MVLSEYDEEHILLCILCLLSYVAVMIVFDHFPCSSGCGDLHCSCSVHYLLSSDAIRGSGQVTNNFSGSASQKQMGTSSVSRGLESTGSA